MKQVKVGGLVVFRGADNVAREYAAGLVRQVGDAATYDADILVRGERDLVAVDRDVFVAIEDSDNGDGDRWALVPVNVWQTTLSQLERVEITVRGWQSGEHSAAEAMELVREQIGDL